jgi:hypothetical protein
MNSLNALGLKVAGITAGALAVVFGLYWGVRTIFFSPEEPAQLAQRDTTSTTPLVDSDGDGLPDTYEAMYQTDPTRPDTDSDGVSDRAEIEAGTDPTIPGPNDGIKPPTGEEALSSGQVAGIQTYTQQYLATLPTDAAREDVLDQTRLEAFVEENRGELLPTLPAGTVQTTTQAGSAAIQTYLDTISAVHNKQLHQITNDTIEAAFNAQLQLNREPMNTIVTQLEQNVKVLKTIPAPLEVADMHEKLIRATQALHVNTTGLRDIDQDFVGGLIATKNIDSLGAIFQEIATSVKELETKYGLE